MTTTVEDYRSVGHALAVPISDEQLWEVTAGFLATGLDLGERVVYFDDGTLDRVLERLTDDGVPVDAPMRDGRFTVVPAEDTRAALNSSLADVGAAVRGVIDDALAAGFPAVRFCGQLQAGLRRTAGGSMLDWDRAVDEQVRDRPASVLCLYDRVRFPDEFVDAMRAAHATEVVSPAIYDDGLLRITATGVGSARVAGEVDHSTRPRIRKLLEAALDTALRAPDAPDDIALDLSSLRFLDVAAAVGLVHAAEEFPSAHRLVLTGVRPRVQRVLDRCGAPFASQLVVGAHPGTRAAPAPDGAS
ncbi:MEDS domain-containing protein [Pseudonocardia sichuanensis]